MQVTSFHTLSNSKANFGQFHCDDCAFVLCPNFEEVYGTRPLIADVLYISEYIGCFCDIPLHENLKMCVFKCCISFLLHCM